MLQQFVLLLFLLLLRALQQHEEVLAHRKPSDIYTRQSIMLYFTPEAIY